MQPLLRNAGEKTLYTFSCGQQFRLGLGDRYCDDVVRTVPFGGFGNSALDVGLLTRRSRRHIGPPKRIANRRLFIRPVDWNSPISRLYAGAGVMRDEPGQAVVGTLPPKELRAIHRMKSRSAYIRRVADVMEPSCGDEQIRIVDHTYSRLRSPYDALNVAPAAWQCRCQMRMGEILSPSNAVPAHTRHGKPAESERWREPLERLYGQPLIHLGTVAFCSATNCINTGQHSVSRIGTSNP